MAAKRSASLLVAILLVLHQTAALAQITVDGSCTLPDAIAAANMDVAVGACAPGSGADIIVVTVPVTLPTVDNITDGPNGLPSIVGQISLEGNNFTIRRAAGAEAFRIFHVSIGGILSVHDATVSGGEAPEGGGIFNRGIVTLMNSTISSNTATSTIGYSAARGGGIFNRGAVTLANSTVSSNVATSTLPFPDSLGGGIHNESGLVTLSNSTVSDNLAAAPYSAYGGGIANLAGGTLDLTDSTISSNVTTSTLAFSAGGGIENQGVLTLTSSTVSGNRVSGHFGLGGGIDTFGFGPTYAATLVNTTVSTNTVISSGYSYGGGIYSGTPLELSNATVISNTSTSSIPFNALGGNIYNSGSSGYATNTLLAGGSPDNCSDPVADLGGNFADDVSCLGLATVIGLDVTLDDNGGPTRTHALLPGSPAIDAGGTCGLPQDQRGAGRVGSCDSGAFEFIPCGTLVLSNRQILGLETWEACLEAQLGANLVVQGGGHLTISAGSGVTIVAPSSFSGLTIAIDPSLQIMSRESLRLQGRGAASGSRPQPR